MGFIILVELKIVLSKADFKRCGSVVEFMFPVCVSLMDLIPHPIEKQQKAQLIPKVELCIK